MDIGKLKDGSLRVWVPFIQGVRIQVRHVARDEFQALLEQSTTQELVAGEIKPNFDNAKFNDLLCKTAVVGLSGIKDGQDPVEFTPELVSVLVAKSTQFVTTVRGVCTDLDRLYLLDAEQTKKK